MNTFPENEIKEINDMLHRVLGNDWTKLKIFGCEIMFEGEAFLGKQIDNDHIKHFDKDKTLDLLKKCSDVVYLNIYRFLNFYYPRWIAFNIIKDSDDEYAEFSSNNELILALTSIIDSISGKVFKETIIDRLLNKILYRRNFGYTKKFVFFLNKYLSKNDIKKIFKSSKVHKRKGGIFKLKNLKNLSDFGKYVYKIRSLIIHEAELGGIYPYNVNFKFKKKEDKINSAYSEIDSITSMITPKIFRRLLWKAIFNYLGIKIIY